jgi:hypothetical protein
MARTCTIDCAYNGPPTSGNGGYCCGLFAGLAEELVGPAGVVQLNAPPPLGTELLLKESGDRLDVWHGDTHVAMVTPGTGEIPVAPFVSVEEAEAASAGYLGLTHGHPFATCVVCGTERTDPAAQHLAPGPLGDEPGRVACTWTPRATPENELLWAILDCPGGWTLDQTSGPPHLLGRMSAQLLEIPQAGETTVVVAQATASSGRTARVLSTMYRPDGVVLGRAEATWVRLKGG